MNWKSPPTRFKEETRGHGLKVAAVHPFDSAQGKLLNRHGDWVNRRYLKLFLEAPGKEHVSRAQFTGVADECEPELVAFALEIINPFSVASFGFQTAGTDERNRTSIDLIFAPRIALPPPS